MLTTIESVVNRSVEVLVVLGDLGSEFDEVEIRIATHQWIEGPGDGLQFVIVGPIPLMSLQGFTDSTGVMCWQHPGDMRVKGRIRAEESPTCTDQLVTLPRQ